MKVFIDSREKIKWDFIFYGFEQEVVTLHTGDYYIEELDLVFERKRSTGEIATNLGKKWKQFEAEMTRMSTFKHAYLICEFPVENLSIFPEKSGIPESKLKFLKMNSRFITYRLFQNCSKYNITPLFFNNAQDAQNGVVEIINEFIAKS